MRGGGVQREEDMGVGAVIFRKWTGTFCTLRALAKI